jgi:DNA-binding NtrC family response regulator
MPDANEIRTTMAETILIVESDVLIRMPIAEYLRACGFRVVEAVDADEAVLVLQSAGVEISVVFSAVELPGDMDGFGLMRLVRERYPETPVILAGTPARAMDAAAELCKSGPDLAKPYEPQLVLDRIRRLLADRARRTPRPASSFIPSVPLVPTNEPSRSVG